MNIHAHNDQFEDNFGRAVMLHGVNLSGSSKVPVTPNGATYIREGFFDYRDISFVGRPFALEQADEHLGRLREWGFNFLRLVVTWEAIEHAGPGIYDEQYLDYIVQVVRKAAKYGFNLFIDPHQDVWSRFTGGDGAPGWTLEAVGFDITHFSETGAAIVHATYGDPLPKMIWSSNSSKLACATMFTLFFGGNDFAPDIKVDGEPAQEYLQRHYFDSICQLAMRLKDESNVIGYDTLNEPYPGYIGLQDLNKPGGLLTIGDVPTAYQSMLLGAGFHQDVPVWGLGVASFKRLGTRTMNPNHQHAWKEGFDCIWRQSGVWDINSSGSPELLHPDYFASVHGKSVKFTNDYYRPFTNRFAQAIRTAHPGAMIFIETESDAVLSHWGEDDAPGIVYAPHWYDVYVVAKKKYTPVLGVDTHARKIVVGPAAIRRSFRRQLANLKRNARYELGGIPFILGEFGIPFDLEDKKAFRTGNFRLHVKALQRTMEAVEANLLNYTLWNYTPDNTNLHGDQWNDEDFSIYSIDQVSNARDIHSGGRALEAVVRPYPVATAGELLEMSFNPFKRLFKMKFRHNPELTEPTEIFVPNYQYPKGYSIRVSDGKYEINRSRQRLFYWPSANRSVHKLVIKP